MSKLRQHKHKILWGVDKILVATENFCIFFSWFFTIGTTAKRGAVVKWLEQLGYVQKVAVSHEFEARLRHAATGKLCQPSRKWVPFSN